MKRVAHNAECDSLRFEPFKQSPEILMQNRIASRDVKIRDAAQAAAHLYTVIKYDSHVTQRHFSKRNATVSCKYITMLTALVAAIGYMPLEDKILAHHTINPLKTSTLGGRREQTKSATPSASRITTPGAWHTFRESLSVSGSASAWLRLLIACTARRTAG
jgi:hypothetical protein